VECLNLNLEKELHSFDWKKLTNVRGAAHDAIIGAWIDWWISIDARKHMVLNPPHKVNRRIADIMFLRGDEYVYDVVGIAEVENSPKKWMAKIRTLEAYRKRYSHLKCMKFLLLCVTTYPQHQEGFAELLQHIMELSETTQLTWILYRFDLGRHGEDIHFIVREDELVWTYDYIKSGKSFLLRNGQIL